MEQEEKLKLIKKIAEDACKKFLKNKNIKLEKYISSERNLYFSKIVEIADKEDKHPDKVSGFIYYQAFEKAKKLFREEQEKIKERNREIRKNKKNEKIIEEIIEKDIENKKIEECLENNWHLIEEENRPKKVLDSSIQKYFDKVGYEGEIESFEWIDWQKEKEKREKEEREDVEQQEKKIIEENKVEKEKSKKPLKKDERLMDFTELFGGSVNRK